MEVRHYGTPDEDLADEAYLLCEKLREAWGGRLPSAIETIILANGCLELDISPTEMIQYYRTARKNENKGLGWDESKTPVDALYAVLMARLSKSPNYQV